MIPEDFANYGTDYKTRAGIALIGLGGIWREDVVYPTAFDDGDGKPLDGANRYVLHFDKGQTPPTNATWSVSMYDPQGYYVPNAINRYNLAAWMPLALQRRRLARSLHPGRLAGRGEGVELAARARERAVQPHGPDLLADRRGARRHLQASTGEDGVMSVSPTRSSRSVSCKSPHRSSLVRPDNSAGRCNLRGSDLSKE